MIKTRYKKRQATFFSLTVIPLLLYIVLFIVPVIMGIQYSLTDWNGLAKDYKFIGIANYIRLFTNKRTLKSLMFTGRYTFFLVVIVMILAMLLTLALTYVVSKKLRTFFRSVLFFPAVLSLVTVGLTWNQILYRVLPPIGQALHIGWLSENLLGSPDTAIWGILIVHIWQGTAIPFVMLLAGIQNVPTDLYEAARIDGAKSVQIFKKITVPFMLPVINVAFVMVLKSGLTVFDYIQAMTGGGPMQTTESAGVLIYELAFKDGKAGFASSYAVLLLAAIAVVSVLQMKISSKVEVGQL